MNQEYKSRRNTSKRLVRWVGRGIAVDEAAAALWPPSALPSSFAVPRLQLTGSFRRGAASAHDVDVLLTIPDGFEECAGDLDLSVD